MTEKQTTPSESNQNQNSGEIISDEDLQMLKNWKLEDDIAAAEAARRTVDVADTPSPTSAATESPTYTIPTTELSTEASPHKKLTGKDLAWGTAVAATLVAGVAGVHSIGGGDDSSDLGESTSSISSITLSPDANIRQDPYVDNNVSGPNTLYEPTSEVQIDTTNEVLVHDGTDNGTWYGLNVEDVAAKIPEAESFYDKDGVVWVNEQGVESVDKNASEESK